MPVNSNLETEELKVVLEPKISLKQISKYPFSTDRGKNRIIENSKYPGDYFPKYYEIARKIICDTLSGNFDDHSLYFEEFTRQSAILKKEAIAYSPEKDKYKNRVCSADSLESFVRMSSKISPILNKYILNSNLKNKRDGIMIREVRVGSMSDMLLYDHTGLTIVGFVKFNFAKEELKKEEAEIMLHILRSFFEQKKDLSLKLGDCMLIDVFSSRIFKASDNPLVKDILTNSCLEIKAQWNLI